MLKFTSFKRQEINLVFKIKVFVVSKIWYFNKSIYFYFPKIWVVTHARYVFPPEYRSQDLKRNIVNRYALTRFTKHLSSYKTMLREMIADHEPFVEVHRHFPRMTEEDFKVFLANEADDFTKAQSRGKDLAEKNIGHHRLGCRGYNGKKPKWDKEDHAYIDQGIENPYKRYADPLFRAFLRSRYRKETETGKLVMDPKVVQGVVLCMDPKVAEVKKVVVRNLQDC
jgi:hypothetical protein